MTAAPYKVFTETVSGAKAARLKEIAAAHRARLRVAPRDIKSLHALGMIECQLGDTALAQQHLAQAWALSPASADIGLLYGLVQLEQKKYAEAIAILQQVIARAPGHIEAHYRVAYAMLQQGRVDDAIAAYQSLLVLKPDHVEAMNQLGNILHRRGDYAAALDYYRRAIALRPTYIMAYNNQGLTLAALGDLDAAEASYRQALALKADYPQALNNLGIVFMLRDHFDEAAAFYRQALALQPDYAEAHSNLGNALKDSGKLEEAITHYRQAAALKDDAEFQHNLSLALLAAGRFEEGWRAYEARWETGQLELSHDFAERVLWRGEPGQGRTLLIHAEQGFGDTLQFCRYAVLAQQRGWRVVMQVQPALARLLTGLQGVDRIVAEGQPLPTFDAHCPMMSLPLVCGTTIDTIPAEIPYLHADTQKVEQWRARLPAAKGMLRVGLVWAGGLRTVSQDMIATNRRRSMAPELLAPLLDVPRVQFYSLQKGAAPHTLDLIDHMDMCEDFADTAALVAALDLIISVDTAMVHLAGALGKTVWMLNRFNSCWRWLPQGEDSAWYPTLRIFRQKKIGQWSDVVARVRDELVLLAQPL